MPTMHELFDGSDTDLLGVFLNTIDEHTTLGDAFLAGLAAGKDCTLIAGVDDDLHSPSLYDANAAMQRLVDCKTCANRGRIDGLSQEMHCEHCKWQERWRSDHYVPNAALTGKPTTNG